MALAIVAIGMAAVLGALTSSADTISYLRDKTFAQWVALNQIASLRISGQLQAPGNSDGDTDFAGRNWHWRQEVTATRSAGRGPHRRQGASRGRQGRRGQRLVHDGERHSGRCGRHPERLPAGLGHADAAGNRTQRHGAQRTPGRRQPR